VQQKGTSVGRAGLGLLAAALLAAGCTRNLDAAGVQTAVADGIRAQLGLEVSEVVCPEAVEMKAGNSFECTARTAGGAEIRVAVDQKDDQGNIEWKTAGTTGLLDLDALERHIGAGIQEQVGTEADVDCGDGLSDTPPGGTLECTATDSDGMTHTVVVTVRDREGNVDWSVGGGDADPAAE
jgi:hypothetical protein